ncbi:MAG: ATP-binding protein [Proteobacteria bacterium]|nr:ATP-binding protein [Pseudomonadota bacterium]
MRHLKRTLATTVKQASSVFPVILLTGPRQVGKTTLLEDCKEEARNYVTLDDLDQRELAQNDPVLFLQTHTPPVIIDEAQYAPNLFSAIKITVDRDKRPGLFWLTGSQKFHLMRNISETLAGRVAIIDMLGLSQSEIFNRSDNSLPFLPTLEWIKHSQLTAKTNMNLFDIYRAIWLGSFPKIVLNPNVPRDIFYNSYIQTYIQRDVRALTRVGDEMAFTRFLKAAAARTAQLINYADLARDVDVDQKTIKAWISILETSGLVYLLQPYHNNVTSRMIKTPKLYFLDTGLCSYLTKWSSPESLEAGAMSGSIIETYMLTEILKSYWHNGKAAHFYFYRDRDQKEVDLLIEQDGCLYPVEFKKSASPSINATKNFKTLEKLEKLIGPGAVICLKEKDVPLSRNVTAIPISYL